MLNIEFVTTEEAAAIIGVTASRVRQLRLAGVLKAERIGFRTLLIPRSEAERIASLKQKTGRPRSREPGKGA